MREPFVAGADDIIDKLVAPLPGADAGFTLIFSASPFPGYQHRFDWVREEFEGNWYSSEVLQMEGWLCPALFKYFQEAPRQIYAQAKSKAQPRF